MKVLKTLIPIALVFSLGLNVGLLIRTQRAPASALTSPTETSPTETSPAEASSAESSSGRVRSDRSAPRRSAPLPSQAPGRMGPAKMADELGLEGDARRRFHGIKREYFQRTSEEQRRVADLQAQLRDQLEQGTSTDDVEPLLQELAQAHGELERLFVEHYFATRQMLTEEQQVRYHRLLMEHLGRRGPGQRAIDPAR